MNTDDKILEAKLERVYHEIFDNLDRDKAFKLNQMCSMFEIASCIYRIISAMGKMSGGVECACEAGTLAQQYMIHFKILMEAFGGSEDDVLKKIDDSSKWLKDKGWYGIPEPFDADGVRHMKTAHGMHEDMKSYIKAYDEIQRVYLQANEERKAMK